MALLLYLVGWFALFAETVQVFHVGVDAIRLVASQRASVVVVVVDVVAGRNGEDSCRGVWQCSKQDSKADQGCKHMDLRG